MRRLDPAVVVGVDAGATHTKATVAALDGTVLGRGRAAGGNARSSTGDPAGNLASALEEALGAGGVRPDHVRAGVLAVAGADTAGRAAATSAVESAWRGLHLPGHPRLVVDIVAAHAAATSREAGLVLLAGTGAIAAAVRGTRVLNRAGGAGWLLGDEGSAVWMGLASVQAAVRALDGREPETPLLDAVLGGLGVEHADGAETVQRVIATVDALPPSALGRLAPLVNRMASEGDPVAHRITDQAARSLLAALDAVRRGAAELADQPPAVAGSVLLSPGPVADLVFEGILDRWHSHPLRAGDGAGGAAWLALSEVGAPGMLADAHTRLTTSEHLD